MQRRVPELPEVMECIDLTEPVEDATCHDMELRKQRKRFWPPKLAKNTAKSEHHTQLDISQLSINVQGHRSQGTIQNRISPKFVNNNKVLEPPPMKRQKLELPKPNVYIDLTNEEEVTCHDMEDNQRPPNVVTKKPDLEEDMKNPLPELSGLVIVDLTSEDHVTCHDMEDNKENIQWPPNVVPNIIELEQGMEDNLSELPVDVIIGLSSSEEDMEDTKRNIQLLPNIMNNNEEHDVQGPMLEIPLNIDYADIITSPRIVRFKSEDTAMPHSNAPISGENLISVNNLNPVGIKEEMVQLTPNGETRIAVQTNHVTSHSFPSMNIIRNPPYIYTKPLHSVEGGFANLTNMRLPEEIQAILSLGTRFATTTMPKLYDYIDMVHHNPNNTIKDPLLYMGEYLKESYNAMYKSLKNQPFPAGRRLIMALENVQLFLNNNKDLRVLQSELGKCTVLMERNEYNRKMAMWIEKCTREGIYQEISDQKYLKRWKRVCHKKLQQFHRELLVNKQTARETGRPEPYPNEIQDLLHECNKPNMPLPFMYGIVKIHKEGRMVRPKFNTRGWYSYGLEKVIGHVLGKVVEPYLQKYNVRDITRTASAIRNTTVRYDYSFIKVDMENVYTDMSHNDIIKVVESLVKTKAFKKSSSMDPELLVRMLKMRLEIMQMFVHDGKAYRIVRGLPQGACDTQALINVVLGFHLALQERKTFHFTWFPQMYKHEDELLLYLPDRDINQFLKNLEECTKLKFKVERERKHYGGGQQFCGQLVMGTLSFLDIEIYRCEQQFLTTVHDNLIISSGRKSLSLRNVPRKWKKAVIEGHLRRIFERVSNPFMLNEFSHLESQFYDVEFQHVLFYLINHYLEIYERIMNDDPLSYSCYPICNFGDMSERICILKTFLNDNFTPKLPPPNINFTKKRPSNSAVGDKWQAKRIKMSQ